MVYFSLLQVLRAIDRGDPQLPLTLLRLPADEAERAFVLRRLGDLARDLDHSPEIVRGLIRHESWNYSVVGSALALALPAPAFTPDIVWRIEHGTWAAPQLAAFTALLGHPDAEGLLSLNLSTASIDSSAKTVLACYAALRHLESRAAKDFSERPLFRTLLANDLDDCLTLTRAALADWASAIRRHSWRH